MSAGSNAPRLRMVSLGLGGAEKVGRAALQQTYGSIQIGCLHRSGKMPRADRGCHRRASRKRGAETQKGLCRPAFMLCSQAEVRNRHEAVGSARRRARLATPRSVPLTSKDVSPVAFQNLRPDACGTALEWSTKRKAAVGTDRGPLVSAVGTYLRL